MGNSLLRYALLALTGIIHLFVGFGDETQLLMVLNGLGYLGFIVIDIIVEYRGYGGTNHLLSMMIYTAITFLGYFIIWIPREGLSIFTDQPLAIIDKVIELILLIHLYQELS